MKPHGDMKPHRIIRPLSKDLASQAVKVQEKLTDEQRIKILEKQVDDILKIISLLKSRLTPTQRSSKTKYSKLDAPHGLNKDNIPIGLVCIGETEKKPFPVCMTVKENSYQVGDEEFASLSAAAEAVSGVRRSGWVFWKVPDGRTLKEAVGR